MALVNPQMAKILKKIIGFQEANKARLEAGNEATIEVSGHHDSDETDSDVDSESSNDHSSSRWAEKLKQ